MQPKGRSPIHLLLVLALVMPVTGPAHAREMVPASVNDIMGALGGDGKGLNLTQDKLPDLFTLTASRLEEDARKFIVVEPFMDGRWKGGKVVIEYARDLSYTMVSIYDRTGHRQRIYSVSSRDRVSPKDRALYQAAVNAAVVNSGYDGRAVTEVVSSGGVEAPEPGNQGTPIGNVPFMAAERGTPVALPGDGYVGNAPPAAYETPRVATSRKKTTARSTSSAPAAASGPTADFVWDEEKSAYVPTSSNVEARAAVEEPAKPVKTEPVKKVEVAKAQKKQAPVEEKPIEVAKAPVSNQSNVWMPVAAKAQAPAAVAVPVPVPVPPVTTPAVTKPTPAQPASASSGFEWNDEAGAYVPIVDPKKQAQATQQAVRDANIVVPEAAPEKSSKRSRRSKKEEVPAPVVPAYVPPPAVVNTPSAAVDATVPSTEELLGGGAPPTSAQPVAAAPEPVIVDSKPSKTAEPKAEKRGWFGRKKEEVPVQKQAPTPKAAAVEPVVEAPVEDEGSGMPTTSESDNWTPKAVKVKPAPEPELPPPPVKVAMAPKPAPMDSSLEAILKAAKNAPTAAPNEGESWVPRGRQVSPQMDAEIAAELERVRQAKKPVPPPVVKVNRDVNNPEEGVLPVSQFEKFEGPRYGRHREYERRFFYGKRRKSKVTDYDFYVDEVDRKKEIHNIYYYKKDRVPKLVAVEKHEKVTFLGNYDVDKEDAGKLIKY